MGDISEIQEADGVPSGQEQGAGQASTSPGPGKNTRSKKAVKASTPDRDPQLSSKQGQAQAKQCQDPQGKIERLEKKFDTLAHGPRPKYAQLLTHQLWGSVWFSEMVLRPHMAIGPECRNGATVR